MRSVDTDTPPARRVGEGSTRSSRGSIPRTGESLTERRPGPMGRPDRPDRTAFRHGGTLSLADGTRDRRRWDRPTAGRDRGVLAQGCPGPGAPDCAATLSDHDALDIVDADRVGDPVVELRRLQRRVPGVPLRVRARTPSASAGLRSALRRTPSAGYVLERVDELALRLAADRVEHERRLCRCRPRR